MNKKLVILWISFILISCITYPYLSINEKVHILQECYAAIALMFQTVFNACAMLFKFVIKWLKWFFFSNWGLLLSQLIVGYMFLSYTNKIVTTQGVGPLGYFYIMSGMTVNNLIRAFASLYNIYWCNGDYINVEIFDNYWLGFNSFTVNFSLELTLFSLLMIIMILIVFLAVLLFSFSYMRTDPELTLFLSYLSLFVASMLLLVAAGDFVSFFIGWEGVGLCSFLLINFWTTRVQASKSAFKALLVNRIGDFFLLVGICMVYKITRSFDFQVIFCSMPYLKTFILYELNSYYVDIVGVCLVIAAVSKSAQAGLHIWLPDAMEGPTPVSAMIHAATMVTAGLYLLLRCSALIILSPITMQLITLIGALTVVLTSILGIWQYDIKKIIAFSTCSQLGYIMTIIGSSYFSLGFFHLLTHAFFKALLFLMAGGIIHAMQGEQDLRRLSGSFSIFLPKKGSVSFFQSICLIGTLSIVGLIFLSGYYSKDLILLTLVSSSNTSFGVFAEIILSVSVFFTSYYSFRLFWLLFFNTERSSTRFYQLNYVLRIDYYIISALLLLGFFSITLGFWLKELVLNLTLLPSLSVNTISVVSVEFQSWHYKVFPLLLILFGFYAASKQSTLAVLQQNWNSISYFFQSKYYYDNLVNKIARYSLSLSTKIYLCLDKGVLEWIGPYGLYLLLKPISRSVDYTLFDKRIETSYLGFTFGIILLFIVFFTDDFLIYFF